VPSALLLFVMSCGPSFTYPLARGLVRAVKRGLRHAKGA
jgi:hypothetical protein